MIEDEQEDQDARRVRAKSRTRQANAGLATPKWEFSSYLQRP
jgi:hypothetical protein